MAKIRLTMDYPDYVVGLSRHIAATARRLEASGGSIGNRVDDVALAVINGYLNDIADRVVETGDGRLLDLMRGLGMVRDGKAVHAPTEIGD